MTDDLPTRLREYPALTRRDGEDLGGVEYALGERHEHRFLIPWQEITGSHLGFKAMVVIKLQSSLIQMAEHLEHRAQVLREIANEPKALQQWVKSDD